MNPAKKLCVFLVMTLVFSGCGYTVSSLLPTHIKTVAIPVLKNETLEYGLEQQLTDLIVRAFVQNNHLKVTDEAHANSIIVGSIVGYENKVFGYNAREQVEEYQVIVTVSIQFKDLVKNREIWSDEKLVGLTSYSVSGANSTTEQIGRGRALEALASDIVTRTVEGW